MSSTPDTSGLTTTIITRAKSQDYGTQVEGQHIFKYDWLNVVAGVGFAKVESDVNITLTGVGPPFGPAAFGTVISEPDIRHRRAHVYANVKLSPRT